MSIHRTAKWRALKFDLREGTELQVDVEVALESIYDLYVNEKLYLTAVLTPFQLKEWSIGFLYSEGLIDSADEVERVVISGDSIKVKRSETKDQERKLPKIGGFLLGSSSSATIRLSYVKGVSRELLSNDLTIPKELVKEISASLNEISQTYRATGGTHSAAIFGSNGELLMYSEDVGRLNAVDKVIGASLLAGMELDEKVMAVSGRISGDLVFKCSRARIPILMSPSAPLSFGLKLAEMAGITLIGFARGDRFNVYTHPHRIR